MPSHPEHRVRRDALSNDVIWEICTKKTSFGPQHCGGSPTMQVPMMLGVAWPMMPCSFKIGESTLAYCGIVRQLQDKQHWHAMAEYVWWLLLSRLGIVWATPMILGLVIVSHTLLLLLVFCARH